MSTRNTALAAACVNKRASICLKRSGYSQTGASRERRASNSIRTVTGVSLDPFQAHGRCSPLRACAVNRVPEPENCLQSPALGRTQLRKSHAHVLRGSGHRILQVRRSNAIGSNKRRNDVVNPIDGSALHRSNRGPICTSERSSHETRLRARSHSAPGTGASFRTSVLRLHLPRIAVILFHFADSPLAEPLVLFSGTIDSPRFLVGRAGRRNRCCGLDRARNMDADSALLRSGSDCLSWYCNGHTFDRPGQHTSLCVSGFFLRATVYVPLCLPDRTSARIRGTKVAVFNSSQRTRVPDFVQ